MLFNRTGFPMLHHPPSAVSVYFEDEKSRMCEIFLLFSEKHDCFPQESIRNFLRDSDTFKWLSTQYAS